MDIETCVKCGDCGHPDGFVMCGHCEEYTCNSCAEGLETLGEDHEDVKDGYHSPEALKSCHNCYKETLKVKICDLIENHGEMELLKQFKETF